MRRKFKTLNDYNDARAEEIEAELDRRIAEMMKDPGELLEWLEDQQSGLWDIMVREPGPLGRRSSADEALLGYAMEGNSAKWVIDQIEQWLRNHEGLRKEVEQWVDAPEEY